MKLRIGLLGGTFNPIHRGHVELGLKIREMFHLERILYVLSARPPHKKSLEIAPIEIRWKMLQKALEPIPYLVPCDIEVKRPTDSWTIDTVNELVEQYPEYCYYFISGSEGFLKIRTWKNYKKLLQAVSFIVVLRKEGHKAEVEQLMKGEGVKCYNMTAPKEEPGEKYCVYLFTYRSDYLYISSTLIRQQIKRSGYGLIENYVGKDVKKIMEEYNLYEN